MHASRQPNSERWVQSNSPFSLVLRDHVDSKLAVAWSKLLAKADWDWEWDWLREQWDGEAGEWEREWRKWVTDQCVRGWDSEWERESVHLLCVRERVRVSESVEWFVWGEWGVIFENTLLEIEYQTLGFTLSKPSLWGSRSTWPNSTWNLAISGRKNRASKARFRGPKSSLWGSSC